MPKVVIALTAAELALVREALDSHRYWQVSDESYRNSGFVLDPASDDPEAVEELQAINELDERLAALEPIAAST